MGNDCNFSPDESIKLQFHFIFEKAPVRACRSRIARIMNVPVPRARASGTLPVHGTRLTGRGPIPHALWSARGQLDSFR